MYTAKDAEALRNRLKAEGASFLGMAGAYVKALFPMSNDWISTNLSPFAGYDFTIDGLNIE